MSGARDEAPRFRITAWPTSPVEPAPVRRRALHLWDDESISWFAWSPDGPHEDWHLLPDELVMRDLLDINPRALDEIVAFVEAHGPIARRFDLFNNVFDGRPEIGLWDDSGGWHPIGQPMQAAHGSAVVNHVVDVGLYLLTMRALVRHWLAYLGGADPATAWQGELPAYFADWRGDPDQPFAEAMSAGLGEYRVRIEYGPYHGSGVGRWANPPQPDLYSAMCLQLFNLMVSDLPVRQCENETCGRSFVKQLGRAEYGQHRAEGVKYCSKACARARAQRQYRRRKREKKRMQHEDGEG